MRRTFRYSPFLWLLVSTPLAHAQNAFDLGLGFGTFRDKATGAGIDTNTFASCTPATDPTCQLTPSLGSVFMGFQGDAMLNKHFGIEGELDFQPGKPNYGPIQYRQLFFDAGGLYTPINNNRWQLRFEGGIGDAHSGFSFNQTSCVGTAVCSQYQYPIGSANHFQVKVSAGLQIYVKGHIFVRPEFVFREVPGFTDQFGTNHVVGGMIWVGYNFGEM